MGVPVPLSESPPISSSRVLSPLVVLPALIGRVGIFVPDLDLDLLVLWAVLFTSVRYPFSMAPPGSRGPWSHGSWGPRVSDF